MDTVIAPPIDASAVARRAEARERVMAYFHSFGLADSPRLETLADRFVAEAVSAGDPASAPMRADAETAAWFARILGDRLTRPELARLLGRAAFLIAGANARWADFFLADEVPDELVRELRRAVPVPAPEPLPAAMVAQPLEVPSLLPSFRRTSAPRVARSST